MKLKLWPADAIIVVAATPGECQVERMAGKPRTKFCRDCHRSVLVDSATWTVAESHSERTQRPAAALCLCCFQNYDVHTATHVEDHRGGSRKIVKSDSRLS
jgi:hypothetical protein